MSEMSQQESQQPDVTNEVMGPQEESGLGALLKDAREKKGLSYKQVAQITRLRRHFLEALENEEWHLLPPPVFVKGFIRSYAKTLGMDEGRLLDLYHRSIPHDIVPPAPMTGPKKPKKGVVVFIGLLLGTLAVAVYLWTGKPALEQARVQTNKGLPSQIPQGPTERSQPESPKREAQKPAKEQEDGIRLPKSDAEPAEKDILEAMTEEKEAVEYPVDEDLHIASTAESTTSTGLLVLRGIVRLRTWVKIYIDDKAPKEYIFQPGSRPQWKAREGFYVLVGNAGGIDFDFEGKELRDLGRLGQVLSLRLPDDFNRQISED